MRGESAFVQTTSARVREESVHVRATAAPGRGGCGTARAKPADGLQDRRARQEGIERLGKPGGRMPMVSLWENELGGPKSIYL